MDGITDELAVVKSHGEKKILTSHGPISNFERASFGETLPVYEKHRRSERATTAVKSTKADLSRIFFSHCFNLGGGILPWVLAFAVEGV